MRYLLDALMIAGALILGPPSLVLPVWWLVGERYETSRES